MGRIVSVIRAAILPLEYSIKPNAPPLIRVLEILKRLHLSYCLRINSFLLVGEPQHEGEYIERISGLFFADLPMGSEVNEIFVSGLWILKWICLVTSTQVSFAHKGSHCCGYLMLQRLTVLGGFLRMLFASMIREQVVPLRWWCESLMVVQGVSRFLLLSWPAFDWNPVGFDASIDDAEWDAHRRSASKSYSWCDCSMVQTWIAAGEAQSAFMSI